MGRFINADSYASTGQGFLGFNMFVYCGSNPVCFTDNSGHSYQFFSARTFDPEHKGGAGGAIPLPLPGLAEIAESVTNAVAAAGAFVAAVLTTEKSEKKNEKTYTVYFLEDTRGVIQYVGRVADTGYETRMRYHQATRGLTPQYKVSGLTYEIARGLEEIGMIECHTINALNPQNNKIHGIGVRNRKGEQYMQAAYNYLLNRAENTLLELLSW